MNPPNVEPKSIEVDFYLVEGYGNEERLTHTDPDEAIEDALDPYCPNLPEEVTLLSYSKVTFDSKHRSDAAINIADRLIEGFESEFGDPDTSSLHKPSEKMILAARSLVDTFLSEYEPWACEEVGRKEINVKQWIEKNRPDWIKVVRDVKV